MNIYSLGESLSALQEIGYTMDAPERMKLELGLLKLTQLAKADQLLFWGKILTNNQPYYIAVGINFEGHYAFPTKKFYYAGSNMNFQQLPELDEYHRGKAEKFNNVPFTGDVAHVLIPIQNEEGQEKKQPEKNEDEDSEEEKVVIVPKNFTELDRLGQVVRGIQIDCQIVPVGAFRMCEKHELRYNNNFRGLKPNPQLGHFQHFRHPQDEKVKQALEKADCIFKFDFLDPIQNPTLWSIQTNTTEDLVTVRSFQWQGYLAYHFLNRKEFGGIYFGQAMQNTDVSFFV